MRSAEIRGGGNKSRRANLIFFISGFHQEFQKKFNFIDSRIYTKNDGGNFKIISVLYFKLCSKYKFGIRGLN
jgi:hypothetical protein